MPVRDGAVRSPTIRRRRGDGKKVVGSARDRLCDDWTGPVTERPRDGKVPAFSKMQLPELGPCGRGRCRQDPCLRHCRKNPRTRSHEVDMTSAAWAKGYGDGTFDVYCRHCGEVGTLKLTIRPSMVDWD